MKLFIAVLSGGFVQKKKGHLCEIVFDLLHKTAFVFTFVDLQASRGASAWLRHCRRKSSPR